MTPGRSGPSPGKGKKGRVLVSIDAALHEGLKRAAQDRGDLPQTELFLDAFANHHQAVQEKYSPTAMQEREGLPPRPRSRPRRRHVGGVSACSLFLTGEEREIIDTLAAELKMSRSELVSRLLEAELGDPST